jgi:hypothetical protein
VTNSITPPPELVKQWLAEPEYVSGWNGKCTMISVTDHRFSNICAKAAQWGADQELEACCEWLTCGGLLPRLPALTESLLAARRPKPPSLKEQALAVLTQYMIGETILTKDSVDTIRRALEALDD